MSKLIQKIEDLLADVDLTFTHRGRVGYEDDLMRPLRAFLAFATDAAQDLTEEEFAEYEQNALAVWEDE